MAEGVRFPVALIHYSSPPAAGEAARIVAGHAAALARAGYPVRLVVGKGAAPSADVDLRLVPDLFPTHPRIAALNSRLLDGEGEVPDDLEPCILDLAQSIGRHLVGCGTVIVHDLLTTRWNLAAAEAVRRLEKGSRGPGIPGSPMRRWVVWSHGRPAAAAGPERKRRPWSGLGERLGGARYVAPSEELRGALAKAFKLPKPEVDVVPGGVDVAGSLGLSPELRALAEELDLFAADLVLLVPAMGVDAEGTERALDIAKAMRSAKRGAAVRVLVAGPPDPVDPSSEDRLARAMARRDELGLGDSVRFIPAECDWEGGGISDSELAALYRLADAVFISGGSASGLGALEGALARSVLALEPTRALKRLVKGEKGVVVLGAGEKPAVSAKRVFAAVAAAPASGLRARVRRGHSWDAIARDFLVPIVEGMKVSAKAAGAAGTKRR